MLRFDLLRAVVERVVLGVGDDRLVEDEIAVDVLVEFATKLSRARQGPCSLTNPRLLTKARQLQDNCGRPTHSGYRRSGLRCATTQDCSHSAGRRPPQIHRRQTPESACCPCRDHCARSARSLPRRPRVPSRQSEITGRERRAGAAVQRRMSTWPLAGALIGAAAVGAMFRLDVSKKSWLSVGIDVMTRTCAGWLPGVFGALNSARMITG